MPLIPAHTNYVEPFAGGLAVLLAKEPASCEVVNDLNSEIVTFYRYVKYHKEALIREMEGYLNARENFAALLANPGLTDLQRAARWYLLKVCSFGGMSEHWGRGKGQYHGFDRQRHETLITAVSERLRRVSIEHGDWEKVVEFYDTPETFFFFDPPYVAATTTAYKPFPEFEMERVRQRLDKLKGRWLLTCDDSPQCRRIFDSYPVHQMQIRYTTCLSPTQKLSNEMLVIHPDLASDALRKAA